MGVSQPHQAMLYPTSRMAQCIVSLPVSVSIPISIRVVTPYYIDLASRAEAEGSAPGCPRCARVGSLVRPGIHRL